MKHRARNEGGFGGSWWGRGTWHTAEAATGGPRQGGWDGVPGLGRAP